MISPKQKQNNDNRSLSDICVPRFAFVLQTPRSSIHREIHFQLKVFEQKKNNCHKETSSRGSVEGEETREDLVAPRRE